MYTHNTNKLEMKTKVQAWGNSLGVRIPSLYVKKLKLQSGEIVTFELETDQIVLKKNKHSLRNLIDNISEKNLHKETSINSVMGNEIW